MGAIWSLKNLVAVGRVASSSSPSVRTNGDGPVLRRFFNFYCLLAVNLPSLEIQEAPGCQSYAQVVSRNTTIINKEAGGSLDGAQHRVRLPRWMQ
jgi:hypothetical protein